MADLVRPLTVAIFTGSRAWAVDEHRAARVWCRRQVSGALWGAFGDPPDVVAHGDAAGLDDYVEEVARWCGVPRIVFPLPADRGTFRGPETRIGDRARPTRGGEAFTYNGPLDREAEDGRPAVVGRNGAMMRMGRSFFDAGHNVYVVALRAPWSLSGGTADAVRHAMACGLMVVAPQLPPEFIATDDGTTSGGST